MVGITPSCLAIVVSLAHCPAAPPHVALAFVGPNVSRVASAALSEAARLWIPYGVSIRSAAGSQVDAVLVRVRFADRRLPVASEVRTLGSIEFHDGIPDPDITIYDERAWELICLTAGAAANHWPTSYRDEVLGRVLGRVLAHELGHFLLQTPTHSASGLMRPVQSIAALMTGADDTIALETGDVSLLTRRTSAAVCDASSKY